MFQPQQNNKYNLKSTISRNSNIEPDDVINLKGSLQKLGFFNSDDEKQEVNPYPNKEMFDGIESFQKKNSLKVDGIVKPDGETIKKIGEKLLQKNKGGLINGVKDSINAYNYVEKIAPKNAPQGYNVSDKYKHAYMSCEGSQNGKLSRAAIGAMGSIRESLQQKAGTNTKKESMEDMKAIIRGWKLGYENQNEDCDTMVQKYYPKFYKR